MTTDKNETILDVNPPLSVYTNTKKRKSLEKIPEFCSQTIRLLSYIRLCLNKKLKNYHVVVVPISLKTVDVKELKLLEREMVLFEK